MWLDVGLRDGQPLSGTQSRFAKSRSSNVEQKPAQCPVVPPK